MNDQSGPYRDVNGPTSVICAQQAVQEFAASDFDVEVLSADHQNKPDVAVSLAREWFDQRGVDIIIDVAATSCALALASIVKAKNKIMIACSTAISDVTGKGLHAQLHALGVRHLHGGELHRRRHGEGRRRHLVFSSPPTTRLAKPPSATPPGSSRPEAAKCSERRSTPSRKPRTSRHFW